MLAAPGTLDPDAVVTIGPAMEAQRFGPPANVTVVNSAPHDAVMKQVSLVVTHGGHDTAARALSNRLPLLVMPIGQDQGDNAARLAARSAGLTLTSHASEEDIAAAITRLITEPQFRKAAVELGESVARDANSS